MTEPYGPWLIDRLQRHINNQLQCHVCGEWSDVEDLVLDLLPSVVLCIHCEGESYDASEALSF